MRLLKTGPFKPGAVKLQLHEFFGEDIPPYAILSHTWGNDEVLFDDVQNGTIKGKEGSAKIDQVFSQARKDGHGWVWVDTCCINKNSSAELSEAINSMYVYYQKAECCYAYLADVPHKVESDTAGAELLSQQFRQSRWFTRGWCLQELLAPRDVQFFSAEWSPLGGKVEWQHDIAAATRVDPDFLTGFRSVGMASIAKRMSWAATRQCTRDEDIAYCLMGLFEVSMPMLYGEGGARAFLRLQDEIMKSIDDHSIFAWTEPDSSKFPNGHGLLADSPKAFLRSGSYTRLEDGEDPQPFAMTNRGLNITLCLTTLSSDMVAAALECPVPSERTGVLVIYLRRITSGRQYVRVDCAKLDKTYKRGVAQQIYVRQNIRAISEDLFRCIQLRRNPAAGTYIYQLVDVFPTKNAWDNTGTLPEATSYAREWVPGHFPAAFKVMDPPDLTAVLMFRRVEDGQYFALLLGMASNDFNLGFQCRKVDGPIITLPVSPTGGLQARGALMLAGQPWITEDHHVQVNVQTFTDATRKIYYVDISIKDIAVRTVIEEVMEVKERVREKVMETQKKSRSFFGTKKV